MKHVELIDAAAPVEARQCCVLSLSRNMRSLFENHLVTLELQVEVEKTQEASAMFQSQKNVPMAHSSSKPSYKSSRVKSCRQRNGFPAPREQCDT